MLKNYIKIAWRNLINKRSFSLVNILGLTIGITSALVLFVIVTDELSYNREQRQYNRIYRVVSQDKYSDGIIYNSGIPVPALDALRLAFPQVTFGAIISDLNSQVSLPGRPAQEKYLEKSGFYFAEPEFFSILQQQWLSGSAAVLRQPNTVVLTKAIAEKYFGSWQKSVGKTIRLDNHIDLLVGGVIRNTSFNTDFPLTAVVSFITLKQNADKYQGYQPAWESTNSEFQVMALLPGAVAVTGINRQLTDFVKKYYPPNKVSVKSNWLQPLAAIHFDKRFDTYGRHTISRSAIMTLSIIGLFILLMACMNFVNLSTAQAITRSKEIGMRKVLGSDRKQLIVQVMGETALIVFFAMILSFLLAVILLPMLRTLIDLPGTTNLVTARTVVMLAVLGLLVTVLSGFYPAVVLSSFKPITALRNRLNDKTGDKSVSMRRILVIVQFAISQVMILGTVVAVRQMNFIRTKDLGFTKGAVLVLQNNADTVNSSRPDAFRNELLKIRGVQSVTFANDVPASDNVWNSSFAFNHLPKEKFQACNKFVDTGYLNTFGLHLIAGTNIMASDTPRQALVNEKMLHALGLKNAEDVIGKPIRIGKGEWLMVTGVVKDFNAESLKSDIRPLIILSDQSKYGIVAVKLSDATLKEALSAIKQQWEQFYPEAAYNASFLDERIEQLYKQDSQLALLYKIFAIQAIIIGGLGLYGLVSFLTVQKYKEVGIRKTLGASAQNIVWLFSREFSVLIFISFILSAPVSWYMMRHWLNDFAYRIPLSPVYFIITLSIALLFAWLAVGYKSVRAALAKPVKSLRSE